MTERENPIASRVLRMFNIFILFTVIRILENALLIVPNDRPDTKNAIGAVVGIVLFFALLRLRGVSNRRIGLSAPLPKIRKSFLIAIVTATISIFTGYMFDLISLKITGNKVNFGIYAYGYKLSEHNAKTYIFVMLICFMICALLAFEYEAVFRGLITRTGRSVLPFAAVNFIQALMFAIFYAVYPLLFSTVGKAGFTEFMIKVIVLYFVHGFILALALGLLRRGDGSLWLSIFTSFFVYYFNSVIRTVSWGTLPMFELRRMVAIDVALLVLSFVYYRIRMNKRQKILDKIKEEQEAVEDDDEEYEYYDEDEEIEKTVKSFNDKLKDASDKYDELS